LSCHFASWQVACQPGCFCCRAALLEEKKCYPEKLLFEFLALDTLCRLSILAT
jgi:hypothetical protein